jgi:hypothetical protein
LNFTHFNIQDTRPYLFPLLSWFQYVNFQFPTVFLHTSKLSQEKTAPESLFGSHIGDEISKNRKRKYTGLQGGIKLIPYLIKSWLCEQQPVGDEASNEGCNSGPTGHDFTYNSIIHVHHNWLITQRTRKKNIFSIELEILILMCKTHV